MIIHPLGTELELAEAAASFLAAKILKQPSLLFCAASGHTPTATYQKLQEKISSEQANQLRILKLDEWGGVSMSNPGTCEQYLQKHLLMPWKITQKRYVAFQSNPKYPEQEIERIQEKLRDESPIDLCVLGLGANGHIGFNEPGDSLQPHCHLAQLSPASLQHTMAAGMADSPTYGLTLGMADILQSRTIVMMITGSHKKGVAKAFLSQKITTQLPASLLWLHPDVHCFIDQAAYG
ncbi:MAG: galactosamine-6-phosphate isomerase [Bacteroidota bacterium]